MVPFLDLKQQYQLIQKEAEEALTEVLQSCCYIGGRYVQEFEEAVAEYLGAGHAAGCGSGTAALMLALRACGIRPGDEVITTPFTFFATAEAVAAIGAVPVFVDIKPEDYTIDPDQIADAVCEKTKAILPVHIFGAVCEMDSIMDIARKHGLKVIEDAAQAIGSEYKGRKAGTIGDAGCFSFYPTKNLGGCGDGGLVTVNDDRLDVIVRALREHGAGKNGAQAFSFLEQTGTEAVAECTEAADELYDPYKYYNYLIGYNSRLDAIQARILQIRLKYLEQFNMQRTHIAEMYRQGLTDAVILPSYSSDIKTCWHQFVIRSGHKQELCSYLSAHGIGNGTFYPVPLHKQKAFRTGNCKNYDSPLPVAEKICAQSVCLPVYPEMTDEQVQLVIDTVNDFYRQL